MLRLYFQGNGESRLKIHVILWDPAQPHFKQHAIVDPVTEAPCILKSMFLSLASTGQKHMKLSFYLM